MKCELFDDIVVKIAQFLDLKDCKNLLNSSKKYSYAQIVIDEKMQQWLNWYNKQCAILPIIKKIEYEPSKYDDFICFLFSNDYSIEFINMAHNKWFEYICVCLRINIYTDNDTVIIKKPLHDISWIFPDDVITYVSFIRGRRRQLSQKYRRNRQKKIQSWQARCICCTTQVNAYNAFFHERENGPICIPCIQENNEFEILGWQNYANLH